MIIKRKKTCTVTMHSIYSLLVLLCCVNCNLCCFSRGASRDTRKSTESIIRFNANGKFKIVQFSDLHYGEAPYTDWGPAADKKSTNVINNILRWERPDFVIFTGDQITGELMYPNATDYIHILLKPLVEKRYRWASVYGNHDIGENVTRQEILRAEQSYGELCYTKQFSTELPGVTNYYIPIYASTSENGKSFSLGKSQEEKPVMLWWFFDSQGGRNQFGQQPHHIDPAVVQWFKNESQRLKSQWGLLPSLVFFHIPPQEYIAVQDNVLANHLCTGLLDDDVTPQDSNTGIMTALAEAGGVKTIFVGHDHGNAWCCFFKNMQVCYNRHTGYGGYGNWIRGARVIELDASRQMNQTNYVRLETGEIVDVFPKE